MSELALPNLLINMKLTLILSTALFFGMSPLSHSLCLGLRQEWSRLERNMLSHQRPEPCQYQPTFCVRRYSLSPDCLVPSIKFNYIVVQGASLVNDGNNLKMMADFGYVEYKGVVYNAQEMYILSPS